MSKIIFLDIDGPMIPGRAYLMPKGNLPYEGVLAGIKADFDPIAVSMLNNICELYDWKIVLHTSWVRIVGGKTTYDHCVSQGLKLEHFHEDAWCDEQENWRYTRVAKWLEAHPGVTQYAILDDEPYQADLVNFGPHPEGIEKHLILIDFDDGLLMKHYNKLRDGYWGPKSTIKVVSYADV